MENNYFKNAINIINELTVYKNIIKDDVIKIIIEMSKSNSIERLFSELSQKLIQNAEINGLNGNLFKKYILNLFLNDENIFSLYCENNINVKNKSIYKIALNDIKIMKSISDIEFNSFVTNFSSLHEILNYIPVNQKENNINSIDINNEPEKILDDFISFYNNAGCGNISMYKMFKYDNNKGLIGIKNPDPITFTDIIGYKTQIDTLIKNTEAFLNGYVANNILLVGARGTGKSSCVKALANKYFENGLRLIEITKEQILILPEILSSLKKRGRRFIIFIDDLSFDEQEIQYKYMKSLLEGGSEYKPENVLFYATSNRRHLIQEKWSDRSYGSEEAEIHTNDTLNEKLSLSDRFGITITYPKPTPKEYIEIVKGIAEKNNIKLPNDILEKEAMKWELNQKGMSGRTAKQFINNITWQLNSK